MLNNISFEKIQTIYDHLMDEESRVIFKNRFIFNITGDYDYFFKLLQQSGERDRKYNYISDFLSLDSYDINRPIVFWGIKDGWIVEISKLLEIKGLIPIAICDEENTELTDLAGLPIITPNELKQSYPNAYILITNPFPNEEKLIFQKALRLGFTNDSIFKILSWHGPEYFEEFIKLPKKGGVFIDAGCFDGSNSIEYRAITKDKRCRIIAFEPSTNNYHKCIENFKLHNIEKNVCLYNKGVWNKKDALCFSYAADGSAISEEGEEKVEVVSIDEVIGQDNVDFIKMDIEGSELEALKGATNVIKKCKPQMAICIYHKPEDILDIPSYILDILPDAKFYIRHKNVYLYDTILYVVP